MGDRRPMRTPPSPADSERVGTGRPAVATADPNNPVFSVPRTLKRAEGERDSGCAGRPPSRPARAGDKRPPAAPPVEGQDGPPRGEPVGRAGVFRSSLEG